MSWNQQLLRKPDKNQPFALRMIYQFVKVDILICAECVRVKYFYLISIKSFCTNTLIMSSNDHCRVFPPSRNVQNIIGGQARDFSTFTIQCPFLRILVKMNRHVFVAIFLVVFVRILVLNFNLKIFLFCLVRFF